MCVCERGESTTCDRLWLSDYVGAVNRREGFREPVCGVSRYCGDKMWIRCFLYCSQRIWDPGGGCTLYLGADVGTALPTGTSLVFPFCLPHHQSSILQSTKNSSPRRAFISCEVPRNLRQGSTYREHLSVEHERRRQQTIPACGDRSKQKSQPIPHP